MITRSPQGKFILIALLALCACGTVDRTPKKAGLGYADLREEGRKQAKDWEMRWKQVIEVEVERAKKTPEWKAERKHWDRVHAAPDRLDRLEAEVKKLKRKPSFSWIPYSDPPYTFIVPSAASGGGGVPPKGPDIGCAYGWKFDVKVGHWECLEEPKLPCPAGTHEEPIIGAYTGDTYKFCVPDVAPQRSPCDGTAFGGEYHVDTTTGEITCVAKGPRQ